MSDAAVMGFTLFAALVWAALLCILCVFLFVLAGVVRAGGVALDPTRDDADGES